MSSTLHRLFMLVGCVLGIALHGCNGNDRFVGVGEGKDAGGDGRDGSADGTRGDGGALGDGGLGSRDGAIDGALDDEDGGAPHELDPTEDCDVAPEFASYAHDADFGNEGGFSLTTGPAGFGVAFQRMTGGSAIFTMAIDAAGMFPKPRVIFNDGAKITDVSLMWNPSGWHLGWNDNKNFTNMGQIQTVALNSKLEPASGAMRTTLTDNTFTKSRPVFSDIAGVPMLAWISSNMGATDVRISGKRLETSSKVVDYVAKGSGRKPTAIALTQIGKAGAVLGWVEEQSKGVWLQQIDDAGQSAGAPLKMSDLGAAGSSVDLATRDEIGGGAIYSITLGLSNHEVRFRRLNAAGAFMGQDIKIIGAPLQAKDASIARLGGGYVVTYRALPGGVIKEPGIRFTFISKEGNPSVDAHGELVSYPVAPSSDNGGRTSVRVSLDGQILIGYLDAMIGGTPKLNLVRQRLDCAQ